MAMGDGTDRASSTSSSSNDDDTASSLEFLRRLGSRSLTEDRSGVSAQTEESHHHRSSLPERLSLVDASVSVRHGTDPHLNDLHYASLIAAGNYVKMGWLTKQGHVWKNWKNRYFVLFHDGTLAYYKAKGKRRMKGCIQLNEGVVSIQHVDVRRSTKPYVFQVEKGYYRMWCCCCSQLEAELWVNALRDVRGSASPCFEVQLTVREEQFGCFAVNKQLNKIFVTDARIQSMMQVFKNLPVPPTLDAVYLFIGRLEDAILDRYQSYLYADPDVQLLSGNELVKLLRRHVEDRAFIPVAMQVYSSLDDSRIRSARSRINKNTKLLRTKGQREVGVPEEIAGMSSDWADAVGLVDALDSASLPSHKIELIVNAGSVIVSRILRRQGALTDVPDETITAVFRFVVSRCAVDDLSLLYALLKPIYNDHPACQNSSNLVAAFIDAIAWIDSYQVNTEESRAELTGVSLASSRVTVPISTVDIGIQFSTDGNGRGAIVYAVRKLSQAALSEKVVAGLSLIAVNDEPVILTPFRDICQRLRTAALPKKLTFMPEFFYYQLLSLDNEMYQYLLCLAADRGDHDSVSWLIGSQLDVNELCSWENSRGVQILGFQPPPSLDSALHAAAHSGHHAMIEYLLRLGARPNLEDHQGRTPLHVLSTTTLDMVAIIEELKNNGAKLDARDRQGVTPLMAMARHGSLEGVATLLALGATLSAVAWSSGYTCLEYAVCQEAPEVVELLLSYGANPNHTTLDGDTSLHLAVSCANATILQLLIDGGGDVNAQNRFGQTPAALLLARVTGTCSGIAINNCLEVLTNAGCDVAKPDLLGRHLLHLAHLSNDTSILGFIQRVLKAEDIDRDQLVDIFGCTARDYSLENFTGADIAHLRSRDPCHLWSKTKRDHSRQQAMSRSKSFDELIDSLLHDVSTDLADLVAFIMFLDSFASLEAVICHLREFISNGSPGRNIVRFIVVLLLFKFRGGNETDSTLEEIRSLIDRHRRRMSHKTVNLLNDYRAMFEQYFQLQGSSQCLEYYTSLPVAMLDRYGTEHTPTFSTVFPRNMFIQVEPSQWAEHCTLLTHALFCSIPLEDFITVGSNTKHSKHFLSAKRWFQHLSAYVVNAVLIEDSKEGRAEVMQFFVSAAEWCLTMRNFDTLAAILYALQSTALQRLRRTLDCLPLGSKKLLNQMQLLSDKGCREVNRLMHAAESPSMPYIGLYLQGFVGLNELPVFHQGDLVNGSRLRKMGELVVEILRRRSVAYHVQFHEDVEAILHVQLPYATDESRYSRSLQLEPREAGAVPLGERGTYVDVDDLDIDNEVRESIGSEGTFGIRQWFRMQKVVHRNRSRSSTQPQSYEWV